MIIRKEDIMKYNSLQNIKLINSICGIRGVHLIASKSKNHTSNLAIFSSITHLGSNPPLLLFVSRPSNVVKRDTISNITETGYYTINSIEKDIINEAHQTSGKYPKSTSEFKECNLEEEYIEDFSIPFVSKSNIKIGMRFIDSVEIKQNQTILVIGEIMLIKTRYKKLEHNFKNSASIIGLNSYYQNKHLKDLEYVRVK